MNRTRGSPSDSEYVSELREANEALLLSAIRQHELNEQAQRVEAALRKRESELRAQAEELERFNRAAVGRELRLIELKAEINELARRHGELPRYSLDFEFPEHAEEAGGTCLTYIAEPNTAAEHGPVPLETILGDRELAARASREPNYRAECGALTLLLGRLAESPADAMQTLAQEVVRLTRADSAGISVLMPDERRFLWLAVAGAWGSYAGAGTPRDLGPCGDAFAKDAPVFLCDPQRRYDYFRHLTPSAKEALFVPFYVDGKPVGALWAVAHGEHRFDAEDLRQLASLGKFASVAYEATQARKVEESRRAAALNLMEDAVRARWAMEEADRELHELNRRKDQFLAMLSHELRNPLASIVNATRLLRLQGEREPDQNRVHGILERQAAQLTRLIDDLLDVSRISTGRIRLRFERVDLADVVRRAIEVIRPQMVVKQQSITLSVPTEPLWMDADAVRLEQVVVNLLNNANKYTGHRGQIEVTLRRTDDEAVLCVRDSGVGIEPKMLSGIFDWFTQANPSFDRAQGGLGIGLAIVQSLVRMHAGEVKVCSKPGEGSEFAVHLPVRCSAPESTVAGRQGAPAPIRPLKVLVVDDNADAANSTASLLEIYGHKTRVAYDGPSALQAVHEFTPEVVLLDLGLPVVDGFDVAKRLRGERAFGNPLLVALTGYGQEADRQRTLEAGFDYHLVKPVDFAEISTILAEAGEWESW